MSSAIPGPFCGFELRPTPSLDGLADCIRAGWAYPGDLEDPYTNLNISGEARDLDRAIDRFRAGEVVAYVSGIGVIFGYDQDRDGNSMVLTNPRGPKWRNPYGRDFRG